MQCGCFLRAPLILAAGAIAFTTGITPAKADSAPTTTVTVGGTCYNVTYFQGTYNDNIAKFEKPPSGTMPWWGDNSLAKSFSDAVGFKLGTPNPGPPTDHSPLFAYAFLSNPNDGDRLESYASFGSTLNTDSQPGDNVFYATATLATTAVPGPAPLFGAAAALGVSRRLRRRIKTSL